MKFIFWTLTIVALILLFPIPLKITLIYDKEILTLKIFNKVIIPSKPSNTKAKKEKKAKKKKYVETPSGEKLSKFKLQDIKHTLNFLTNSKLKFFLWIDLDLLYAMDDAAVNAILYGLLHQASSLLHMILRMFFRVKKYSCNIKNQYNRNFFKLQISSIILINIATIIYMVVKIYYGYIERREPSSRKNLNIKEEF